MIRRLLVVILTGVLVATAGPLWAGDKRSKEYGKGQAFCPAHVLVVGNVIVQPGRCYVLAPEVFGPDEYGHSEVLLDEVPPELHEKARIAEANCPERAISIED